MGKIILIFFITVSIWLSGCHSSANFEATPKLIKGLKDYAKVHDLEMGTSVLLSELRQNSSYKAALLKDYSLIVPENEFKFSSLRPTVDGYYFEDSDEIVNFAQENNIQIRGHTLVWHRQLPLWLLKAKLTKEMAEALLRDHITRVVKRYKGIIKEWDVVNEALNSDGTLRKSFWHRTIGPDYIEKAFIWAHEADPDARLLYNDYESAVNGPKAEKLAQLLSSFKKNQIPINGIGLQMHLEVGDKKSIAELADHINYFSKFVDEVHISELDIRSKIPPTAFSHAKQASMYREIVSICKNSPHCKSITLWGVSDAQSWIPRYFPSYGNALLLDDNFKEKEAYNEIINELDSTPAD